MTDVSRRRMLFGGAALGAGALLAACTSNDTKDSAPQTNTKENAASEAPGKAVTIGFSAPAADHGWIGAITANAKAQAAKFSDVTLKVVDAGKDAPAQIAALETLIAGKPDAIVLLPQDGAQLTAVGKKAMDAGIIVINLDREFSDSAASFSLIKGDNYGMGVAAGHYVGEKLKGKTDAVIGEIPGIDELQLTKDRSKGFADTLKTYGLSVKHRVAAGFTVQTGQSAAANLLQAAPKLDAVWNHDDDQGVGVLAAIQQAGRKEFFMVGGAGSRDAMDHIKNGDTVLTATVTYPPSMASSAIILARLAAQGKGMGDLVELQVPKLIVLQSETITKDNVDKYLPLGFKS
ncbi:MULTISPECIES: substrate-binding domain-containing protein [Dactylosporangium]|uniref:Sugar ABC transporter substrate-binding protein n=2 Tax=Dactylosporangium TaxID=35753 RepID=A0A9W6KM50_9ACTN|nr:MULTISPECIES: substrate-binding domain-containing protein [Dactylosporangium]UAB95339.1 substrate-binding domain-containing protein [Dactylosporangium vinaceum]UWZ43661.1 substrate-binding domain-containing protein [Dactylosporangium matsuzakiense]GLL04561.1 sugar ABC transporter substrate-binding protein [Dactylosporangium matsuzakiense]